MSQIELYLQGRNYERGAFEDEIVQLKDEVERLREAAGYGREGRVDHTGDIAIPDEVVDLRLLLECRRERDEARRECDELQRRLEKWQQNETQFATNQQVARLIRKRDEALAEVERLRGASKFLDKNLDNYKRTLDARETNLERREAELDKLESEAERLREDAERYRWLRDNADMQFGPLNTAGIFQPTTLTHAEIDAAIDAAMGG